MDRPAFNPGDIVEVPRGSDGSTEIGVVIGVIDCSEDRNPSLWEVWIDTANARGGMFDPDQVRRIPDASVSDLPAAELRETWLEIRRQGDD